MSTARVHSEPNTQYTAMPVPPFHVLHQWIPMLDLETGEIVTDGLDDLMLCCSVEGCCASVPLRRVRQNIDDMLASGIPLGYNMPDEAPFRVTAARDEWHQAPFFDIPDFSVILAEYVEIARLKVSHWLFSVRRGAK